MKPTKKIPDNYLHVATYDPHQYWKALWILFGIAALITIASFWLWSRLQTHETVGIQSLHRQNVNLGRITWAIFISLGLICIHELIHAALFWVYTKEWPKIAIRVYGIQVQGGEWFIPRNQFILINITPVALLSILGGFLLLFLPKPFNGPWIFALIVNAAGSIGDIASSIFASVQSDTALLTTSGSIWISNAIAENTDHGCREKIRFFLEKMLSTIRA